jgi:hypothetical protein
MESARIRIVISWVVATFGAISGLPFGAATDVGQKEQTYSLPIGLLFAVLMAYSFWSIYWGMPPVWRAWRNYLGNMGCFVFANPVGWLILLLFFFYIPFVGAMFYGLYGGGIYEYLKCRRIAMGLPSTFTPSDPLNPTLEDMLAEAEAKRSFSESQQNQIHNKRK